MSESATRRIGPDRVIVRDGRVSVITSVEMPDWEVRRHRVTLIRFDGGTFRVSGKTHAAGKVRYELTPWVPADEYVVGLEIEYSPAYVAARDRVARDDRRGSYVTFALRVVSPLIGFLSGRTKERLEAAYGVDPVSTTFQSVFLEFLITIGAWTLAAIGQVVRGLAGTNAGLGLPSLGILGLVFAIDASMRYSRILREERPPPGFYEWVIR